MDSPKGVFERSAWLERLLPPRDRPPMVGWYDPGVLAQSGWLVAVANLFGRHSDTRLLEALANQPQGVFDYSEAARGEDFWLDYVADMGDGFNSTYAIAHALSQRTLEVREGRDAPETTRRGQVLIFGGDEVYPYPSREAYELRTENPWRTALAGGGAPPDLFAVPGNHDWYDSLVAFSRAFCRPERGFAGMRTQQTRSYFALKLPAKWWLLAIDLQLGSELDEPQVQYFQRVAAQLEPDARIVLCVPEPQWILDSFYAGHASYSDSALRFFEERVIARKVQVFLTGDQHYYKRHENEAGVQKIVAGGGGAFLHPTHAPDTSRLSGGFRERAVYPPKRVSSALTWKNLLFPFVNPQFVPMSAALYALSAWFASSSLTAADLVDVRTGLHAALTAAVRDPVNGLWLLGFIAAFVFFTDTHIKWYRIAGGVSHAVSHLFAAFGVGWLALYATTQLLDMTFGTIAQLMLAGTITFVVGGFVGATIMGIYLTLSLQIFKRHSNEAFSSLRIQDYKNWLRLRIAPDGSLTVFAIGIDRVARAWRRTTREGMETYAPRDRRATKPRLIDRVRIG